MGGMGRIPREPLEGAVGHVFTRGNDRQAIFRDDEDRRHYLALLASVVETEGLRCLAYCLMTNHVHLLVEVPRENLPRAMWWLNRSYAGAFNRRYGRVNHVFGGPYGLRVAREPEHLWFAAAYVALNPVKAGLCARPEEWPWSSHSAAVGEADLPRWLDVHALLGHFESLGGDPRRRYREFVDRVP